MKFEVMVIYENSSNKFDIVRPFPHDAIEIEWSNRSTLTQARMLILIRHACSTDNNIPNL